MFDKRYPTLWEHFNLSRGKNVVPKCLWQSYTVIDIITNIQYTGAYVSSRYLKKGIGSKKHTCTDKSEWTVIYNNHEPIISQEVFYQVQKILKTPVQLKVRLPEEKLKKISQKKLAILLMDIQKTQMTC